MLMQPPLLVIIQYLKIITRCVFLLSKLLLWILWTSIPYIVICIIGIYTGIEIEHHITSHLDEKIIEYRHLKPVPKQWI